MQQYRVCPRDLIQQLSGTGHTDGHGLVGTVNGLRQEGGRRCGGQESVGGKQEGKLIATAL